MGVSLRSCGQNKLCCLCLELLPQDGNNNFTCIVLRINMMKSSKHGLVETQADLFPSLSMFTNFFLATQNVLADFPYVLKP